MTRSRKMSNSGSYGQEQQDTNRHVQARPGEGSSNGVDQLARHAKVTEFHDALPCKENVRGLDIAVDRLARVQVGQALQDLQWAPRVRSAHSIPTSMACRASNIALTAAAKTRRGP